MPHCSWFVRCRGHLGCRRRAAMSRGHLGPRRGPAVSRDHLGVQRGAAVGRGHLELRNRECHEPEESLGNVGHLKICYQAPENMLPSIYMLANIRKHATKQLNTRYQAPENMLLNTQKTSRVVWRGSESFTASQQRDWNPFFCIIIACQLVISGLVVQQHHSTAKFQLGRSTWLGSTAWLRWTPSKDGRLRPQG